MENFKLVLPEHLNHYQYLFGGYLLKFVDESAWIAATLDYPGFKFMTIGMDRVEFLKTVREGTILRIRCEQAKIGNTSVQYQVDVFKANSIKADSTDAETESVFSTNVTLVRVDDDGRKKSIAG